jgi:hypothetical protein
MFFRGQGGSLTSPGMSQMSEQAKAAAGINADVFDYDDLKAIEAAYTKHSAASGSKIAAVGYSLGVSTATYLQTKHPFALVLCIAASEFAQNYPISKTNTKRSVLWRSFLDPLSSAGGNLGFDTIHDVFNTHLLMDVATDIQAGVLEELKREQRV